MTIRGEKVTLQNLMLSAFGFMLTILVSIATYYAKTGVESISAVKDSIQNIEVRLARYEEKNAHSEFQLAKLQKEVDDMRIIIYDRMLLKEK